jgi:hypothetical protein
MVRIAGEIVIERPVEEVFDFVADARNEPCYNRRLRHAVQITAGPVGRGTRFREETIMLGRPVVTLIEHTAYERPRRLVSAIQMATMDIQGALTFDPVPGGTRMRWSWDLAPRGVFRLLTPLIARFGPRFERSNWANLKRFLEARTAPPQAHATRRAVTAPNEEGHHGPVPGGGA